MRKFESKINIILGIKKMAIWCHINCVQELVAFCSQSKTIFYRFSHICILSTNITRSEKIPMNLTVQRSCNEACMQIDVMEIFICDQKKLIKYFKIVFLTCKYLKLPAHNFFPSHYKIWNFMTVLNLWAKFHTTC